MKTAILFASLGCSLLVGCAFPQHVQRFGVEYNEALASMANEQTLLNILRASKGMPTHFSSVSRFTGALSMRANSSVNGQLRGSGLTQSDTAVSNLSTVTTVGSSAAPTGLTTSTSVATTSGTTGTLLDALAEGVDVYTPQIGGELASGTNFDVQVYDQQKFYQGILGAVPFTTVEMLINQGFEPDLVANLLVSRVDFYRKDPRTGAKSGDLPVASYRNDSSDRVRFQQLIDCNQLDVMESKAPATMLAPISRLELGTVAAKNRLTLEQLTLFDGDKFALSASEGISPDGSTDSQVYVVKPGGRSRVPRLIGRSCVFKPPTIAGPEGVYLNDGTALVMDTVNGRTSAVTKPVVLEMVFRSPEAVLRAVGDMVRLQGTTLAPSLAVCPGGGTECVGSLKHREPVFAVAFERQRGALLATRFMDANYSVPGTGFRSMQVITIIQQLVNLQKESTERALSIPVRAVP